MVDKNQAVIDFLLTCPQVKENPLYFNFSEVKEDAKSLVVLGSDSALNKQYIDGTVLKRYTVTVIDYKAISYQAIVKASGKQSQNVGKLLDIQSVIDWVNEQDDNRNYPDFGNGYFIDSMSALTDNPNMNGVDTTTSRAIAKYSFSIQIVYLDSTKKEWN